MAKPSAQASSLAGDNGFGNYAAVNGGNIVIAAVLEPASVVLLSNDMLSAAGYAGYCRRKEERKMRVSFYYDHLPVIGIEVVQPANYEKNEMNETDELSGE